MVINQIEAAQALAAGTRIAHVKAHGALSNLAMVDADLAGAFARAVRTIDRSLVIVVMPGLAMETAARAAGLPIACGSSPIEPMTTTTATWRPAKGKEPSFTTRVWQPRGCAA